MEQALPLKTIVLFIACGTLVAIIIFIFAKRQITRYALKSRGPHVNIGSDAPKDLKNEIERRLLRVSDIQYEPELLPPDLQTDAVTGQEHMHFFYRMKACDALTLLDTELQLYSPHIRRVLGQHTLRSFLLEQRQSGALEGCKIDLIEKFTEAYSHARHDPMEFLEKHYKEYMELLNQLIDLIRQKRQSRGALHKKSEHKDKKDTTKFYIDLDDVQVTYRPNKSANQKPAQTGGSMMRPSSTGSSEVETPM